MYLGVEISVASFVFAWGLGSKDIRVNKKNNQPIEEGDGGQRYNSHIDWVLASY
jgi:hypothetical protein